MNLRDTLRLYNSSDGLGPGAIGVPAVGQGVVSPAMKKFRGKTQVEADASPSDLASHHLWTEPSATDVTQREWRAKRKMEKEKGRNMDPYEAQAEEST